MLIERNKLLVETSIHCLENTVCFILIYVYNLFIFYSESVLNLCPSESLKYHINCIANFKDKKPLNNHIINAFPFEISNTHSD